jgi:hypothetical protein
LHVVKTDSLRLSFALGVDKINEIL